MPQAELAPSADTLSSIRLAVFDFDGVFTDNHVWVDGNGGEMVRCCRADGLGLRRLREAGVDALIVSMEVAPVVGVRARKLGLECLQGIEEKLDALREQAAARGVGLDETAYVGNDLNDVSCLEAVGLPVVPADAWPEALEVARWVLTRRGGEGCVREFCDAVWAARVGVPA
ncbi:MAG TPA: HAD hydrolase family protein [Gaiellaceae bacterium]|nr:HAD hydrolase family protein [Gaiellaceae bacterium]